jgi:hypothetical protein
MTTQTTAAATSLTYNRTQGWSSPLPALDSPMTLVLAFASRGFDEDQQPLAELARAYPNSVIAGCSTSGEIHGAGVTDGTVSAGLIRFERTRLAFASAPVRSAADSHFAGDAIGRQLAGQITRNQIRRLERHRHGAPNEFSGILSQHSKDFLR